MKLALLLILLRDSLSLCPNGFTDIDPGSRSKNSFSGDCIKVLPPMTYDGGMDVCECYEGHLARMDNRRLVIKISSLAPVENGTYQQMWIGYTDRMVPGYWIDSDGKYPGAQNWGTREDGGTLPDNAVREINGKFETQDCAVINFRMRSLWDDDWCSTLHYAACQTDRNCDDSSLFDINIISTILIILTISSNILQMFSPWVSYPK